MALPGRAASLQGNCVGDPALPAHQLCWASSSFAGNPLRQARSPLGCGPRVTSPGLGLTLERRRLSSKGQCYQQTLISPKLDYSDLLVLFKDSASGFLPLSSCLSEAVTCDCC